MQNTKETSVIIVAVTITKKVDVKKMQTSSVTKGLLEPAHLRQGASHSPAPHEQVTRAGASERISMPLMSCAATASLAHGTRSMSWTTDARAAIIFSNWASVNSGKSKAAADRFQSAKRALGVSTPAVDSAAKACAAENDNAEGNVGGATKAVGVAEAEEEDDDDELDVGAAVLRGVAKLTRLSA